MKNRLPGYHSFICLLMVIIPQCMSGVKTGPQSAAKMAILVDQNLSQCEAQYKLLMQKLPEGKLPRSYEHGRLITSGPYAWTSGFYSGTLFNLFKHSGDSVFFRETTEKLKLLTKIQDVTSTHDLGFMMYSSFGPAWRLTHDARYKTILLRSAESLASRFNPSVGCIKSWDHVRSLNDSSFWSFPVIIDNMMNLELLFFASRVSGDPHFKEIAIRHAETTLKNHLRSDYSSYHVVNYDPETGQVKSRETHQGFADNSTWARGQAWGIYGFTMVYRETRDKRFLNAAEKMAAFFIDHKNLPADKVPYWDFNVGQSGYSPLWPYKPESDMPVHHDASAAAIVSSALIELAGYTDPATTGTKYLHTAETILASLSANYRVPLGQKSGFILDHSVGGFPSQAEIDVPLTYADYYYVEALTRYHALVTTN